MLSCDKYWQYIAHDNYYLVSNIFVKYFCHQDERYQIEQRIDHVTNESVDATRRIRQVAEETNRIGVDTLVTVNEQGEQLDNVENRLDEINVDLKHTDKNLTKLETCCCCFNCCAPKDMQKTRKYKKVYGKKAQNQQMEDVVSNQPRGSKQDGGKYVKRVTDDAREDEMEDNLQ